MHTSRLKRKLNDLGVDTTSTKANENFCLIGTPLPPLEKSKDTGEFVPLWKQEVRDEKGRRRLHGAFTGGFSAGYFNTVGSKEGWTPSTFKSSRSDRAKAKAARPEDFMDEEDLAESRDSQKLVDTTDEMDMDFWERGRKKETEAEGQDSITSALQAALLPTPVDSAGGRILKKMGWRPGQGIGPKLTYEQRRKQDLRASAPLGSGDDLAEKDEEDHEEAKKHMYPQRDTKVPVFRKKEDTHGLGYVPGLSLNDMLAKESGGEKGPNISAGFGLGALNDADEDDLDVYDSGASLSRGSRRVAYDNLDDKDEDRIIMGSRNKADKSSRPGLSKASRSNTDVDVDKDGRRTRFNDGTPVLQGFFISDKPVVQDVLFPLPKVPEDWSPNPRRVWEQDKENLREAPKEGEAAPAKHTQEGRQKFLTADQRGSLLGETPLSTKSRSVFDYLAPKDRERLKNLASIRIDTSTPTPGPSLADQTPTTVPRLDPQIAKMALQGFQPYKTDLIKNARYTAFLQAQAAGSDSVPFGRNHGQSTEAFNKELEDYAKSAAIFKPVSAAMAGRFTSAAVVESGPKAVEGLHRPEKESYLSKPTMEEKKEEKEESPKENAARLGMFGPLTREVKPWIPNRLLCKRFGVKEPEVEVSMTQSGSGTAASAAPGGGFESGGVLAITDGSTGLTQITDGAPDVEETKSAVNGKRDLANIGLGEDETQGRDILTYEKPARDIFKAIFASDEEDENEEEVESPVEKKDVPVASTSKLSKPEPVKNIQGVESLSATSQTNESSADQTNGVNLASFKPTFVPRTERQKEKEKEKTKSEKKHKDKRKKGKVLVSFEVDEEGADGSGREAKPHGKDRDKDKEREKRKKKWKEDRTTEEEDESMWVEKPPPDVVYHLAVPPPPAALSEVGGLPERAQEAGPPRGRKRAIDFM